VKIEFDTAPMRAPELNTPVDGYNSYAFHPGNGTGLGATNPAWVWYGHDGPSKYRLEFFEITAAGQCSDTPLPNPITGDYMVGGQPCDSEGIGCGGAIKELLFPSPNPTGYCWTVTSIAANGKESQPSEMHRFSYVDFAPNKLGPGIQIGEMATAGKTWTLEGDSYGSPVTFQWDAAPDAVAYGFKLGRYPWDTLRATPDPLNCWVPLGFDANSTCSYEPLEVTYNEAVTGTEKTLDGALASHGRYCWTIWPIIEGDRQPLVDSFPQLCYTSGPDIPKIECDKVPADGTYTGQTIGCTLTSAYVPAGQLSFDVTVDGKPAGNQLEVVSVCKPDPEPPQPHHATFGDIYDCETKFNIKPQRKQHVVITAHTWNSSESPPVKDDDSKLPDVVYDFDTGTCGVIGEACCPQNSCDRGVCNAGKCVESVLKITSPTGPTAPTDDWFWLSYKITNLSPFVSSTLSNNSGIFDAGTIATTPDPELHMGWPPSYPPIAAQQRFTITLCPVYADKTTGKCDSRIVNPNAKDPTDPPTPTCSSTLSAPVLPQPLAILKTQGCAIDNFLCMMVGGNSSSQCDYFVQPPAPMVGWDAVPGATNYKLTQIGGLKQDGTVSTKEFTVPGASGHVQQAIDLTTVVPLYTPACNFQGYGIVVKALDDCGHESPTAITAIGYKLQGP
jgi:hypothetical protein